MNVLLKCGLLSRGMIFAWGVRGFRSESRTIPLFYVKNIRNYMRDQYSDR